MPELTQLEIDVLNRIKPRKEEYEKLLNAYYLIKKKLEEKLSISNIKAEVTMQGSVAHDTWLSGDRDIDVFILFPEDWSREDLEKKGLNVILEAARDVGKYELRYAEHPYVRVEIGDVAADVVPALRISDPSRIKTAVDRTPFHTLFVNNRLNSELRDHVRLLKKFMKAIGVYGAEIKTRGFSGYVVELLVITYGGFREVLKEASRWRPPVIINTIGDKLNKDLIRQLRTRYPDSAIYMPDPVDPLRNVTASVSMRSLFQFVLASQCYLRSPSSIFFEEGTVPDLTELMENIKDRCIVFLDYQIREELPPDVIWGEAWRLASTASRVLRNFDIGVIDYSVWTNEKDRVLIGLELDRCDLGNYKLYHGPCVGDPEERVASFIRKHIGTSIAIWINQAGCLDSIEHRKVSNAVKIIEDRWQDYTVSPHFKTTKPSVRLPTVEELNALINLGAGKWLWRFIVKTPSWMEKCISSRE